MEKPASQISSTRRTESWSRSGFTLVEVLIGASLSTGLLAGVLDATGTAFYVLAQEYVRLDVAAVLSSFYPAATVVLARLITHEPVTATQWFGASVCVAAVALIAA